MQLQTALFFETPDQIFGRVFTEVSPSTPVPRIVVRYRKYANANSRIRLRDGVLEVSLPDLLDRAPAPVVESLAWILISKLFRYRPPESHSHRYRLYLNRKDVRQEIHQTRKQRGRKFLSGPQGEVYDLHALFEDLNLRFFNGLMARPDLGWSRQPSRTLLGHYDPSHHAIILSRILDQPLVPRIAVEYVLYHEMLHLRFPAEHRGARRCVHTPEFKAAEREFPQFKEARKALKNL